MAEFSVNGFLICYPVYALLKNLRRSPTGYELDGFAWVASGDDKAFCLFTDADLAERYLRAAGQPPGVVLFKCVDGTVLASILNTVSASGFAWVAIDATTPTVGQYMRRLKMADVLHGIEAGPK